MIYIQEILGMPNSIFSIIDIADFLTEDFFGIFKDMDRCPNVSMLILLEFEALVS